MSEGLFYFILSCMSEIMRIYREYRKEEVLRLLRRIGNKEEILRFVASSLRLVHSPHEHLTPKKLTEFEEILSDLGLADFLKERKNTAKILAIQKKPVEPHKMSKLELLVFMAPYFKDLRTRKTMVELLFFEAFAMQGYYDARDFVNDSDKTFAKFDKAVLRGTSWPSTLVDLYHQELRHLAFKFIKTRFAFLAHNTAKLTQAHLWFLGEEPELSLPTNFKNSLNLIKSMSVYFDLPRFGRLFDNSVAASIAFFHPYFVGENVFALKFKAHSLK